jgi:hypothetical protein
VQRTEKLQSLGLMVLMAVTAMTGTASAQGGAARVGPFDPRAGRFGSVIAPEPARAPDTVSVSSDKVWAALIQVYADLGIPLTVADTQNHVIGALRVTQHKPVGGQPLSRLLECGMSSFGQNADRYTVQLTALSSVQPVGERLTVIDTRVSGSASPNGINSTVACASSGALEEKMTSMVRKALGQ